MNLSELTIDTGSHRGPQEGMCVMEMVSYVAMEPWSDHPSMHVPRAFGSSKEGFELLDDIITILQPSRQDPEDVILSRMDNMPEPTTVMV